MRDARVRIKYLILAVLVSAVAGRAQQTALPAPQEGSFIMRDFRFQSGETLPELRLHYRTLGTPARDAQGRVTNAVLLLHGTSGTGANFLAANFAGELFGPGQLLDAGRYYLIIPDNIGTGRSTKPSDGLRMRFPKYDYDDMVLTQQRLLTEHLKVDRLRLLLGTSQGCMHAYLWAIAHADFMDAVMAMACQPMEIAGLNRMRRKMMVDAIKNDPEWKGGEYQAQPKAGLSSVLLMSALVGVSQLNFQLIYPTREAMDKYVDDYVQSELPKRDANDVIYQYEASRNYDPHLQLSKITTHFLHVNSADDIINPPELGSVEREIKKVKNGRFVLLPISEKTRGHQTYNYPALWKQYVEELLKVSAR